MVPEPTAPEPTAPEPTAPEPTAPEPTVSEPTERHYLDHASTSPIRPAASEAMIEWLRHPAGDPGRIHSEGMRARVALEEAREQVAELFGARPREVVFTSGATESIATAIWGAAARSAHIVVPEVEHSAVRESAWALVEAGTHTIDLVGVDSLGRVDLDELVAKIKPYTALVTIQWGNHEVGTLQPVEAVVAACRDRDVLVHVDAAAANGHVPIAFDALGADLLSVSSHKFGGPPGAGALMIRRGLRLRQLLRGGDQERDRRAGMENLPAVAGFAAACSELATGSTLEAEAGNQRRLTDRVLLAATGIPGLQVYGDPVGRLPHIVCLGIEGIEPQAVLLGLDQAGIAVHSGSACSTASLEPSPVLQAMGVDAHRSLRVSTGWNTTDDDIDSLIAVLPIVIGKLRSLRG